MSLLVRFLCTVGRSLTTDLKSTGSFWVLPLSQSITTEGFQMLCVSLLSVLLVETTVPIATSAKCIFCKYTSVPWPGVVPPLPAVVGVV